MGKSLLKIGMGASKMGIASILLRPIGLAFTLPMKIIVSCINVIKLVMPIIFTKVSNSIYGFVCQ